MAKILYFNIPAHGHVNPSLPVVRELVRRGETVVTYNTDEFRPLVEPTGAAFRPYPPTALTAAEIAGRLQDGNLARISALFLQVTEQLLPFALDELARERPDLILFDGVVLWGRMAAAQQGLPAAATLTTFILDGTREVRRGSRALLQALRWLPQVPEILQARLRLTRAYGKAFPNVPPLFPVRGGLNILFTARELQPPTHVVDQTFRFVGPAIDPAAAAEPLPFDLPGRGPLVYISLGTIHNRAEPFYRQCFEAFADYPARFVLSAGKETDLPALGEIPPNFVVRPSVPQLAVLAQADAFITHGGVNSIHEGLYFGVPLLLIPQQLEQLFAARIAAGRGPGRVLEEMLVRGRIKTAALRAGLAGLLEEPRYGEAAAALQTILRGTGGYRAAADEIQAFIARAT